VLTFKTTKNTPSILGHLCSLPFIWGGAPPIDSKSANRSQWQKETTTSYSKRRLERAFTATQAHLGFKSLRTQLWRCLGLWKRRAWGLKDLLLFVLHKLFLLLIQLVWLR